MYRSSLLHLAFVLWMANVTTLAMSASTLATGQAFRMETQPVASLRGFRLLLLHGSLSFFLFTILDARRPRFIQRKSDLFSDFFKNLGSKYLREHLEPRQSLAG